MANSSNNDKAREHRIDYEIVVDCYNEHETYMGWFCYLEERLTFPCKVRCLKAVRGCPLQVGDEAMMKGLMEEDQPGPFDAIIEWKGDEISVPLALLEVLEGSEEGREAVADWRYWVATGREF